MKSSLYNLFVEAPTNTETVLFNTLYGSLSLWPLDEVSIVKRILADPTLADFEHIKTALIQQKHLIDDFVDEIAIVKNRKIEGIQDENRLDVVIMPTFDCNFACKYCYEVHRPSMMTSETEEAVKAWLATQIPRFKVVMLLWYGGEPLLTYRRAISISEYARQIASKTGVSCILHMTTNGYLLNPTRAKELLNAGIYDFQITLDGPPAIHDQLRVLRTGKGTFSRVFRNINLLAQADQRVKISLRVNFNHTNLHTIPQLLEMFPSNVRPQLRIVYEPIFGNCSLSATDNIPSAEISESMAEYYKIAKQLGYDVVLGLNSIFTGKLVYCYAERANQFIVNYNGDVYKCSVSEFRPEERVAYIRCDGTMVKDDVNWNKWISTSLFEDQCCSCVYLPLCMGGCRKTRLQHQGTGSYCSLVPTNASYILKQVALGGFEALLGNHAEVRP